MGCCGKDEESDDARDDDFDGPVAKRKCQDVFWLLFFLLFLVGMFAAVGYAASRGDIDRITKGMDSYGNICGKNNKQIIKLQNNGQNLIDKPYVYRSLNLRSEHRINYTSIKVTDFEFTCVEQCPTDQFPILNRCVPRGSNTSRNEVSFFQNAAEGVQFCWKELVYLCVIAVVLTIIMLLLLRYLTAFMVYLAIITMIVLTIAITAFMWYKYSQAKKLASESVGLPNHSALNANATQLLIGAVLFTITAVGLLLVMFFIRKELKLVIQLIKEAAKAIAAMPFILIQPIWTFLIITFIYAMWLYALMWVQSSGELVIHDGKVRLESDTFVVVMRWYFLFGLIWMMWFCFGCQNVVVAGAVAKWFFTRDKSQLGSPILTSLYRVVRFHTGSVAVGSLIISIIKMIRLLVHSLEKSMKDSNKPAIVVLYTLIHCFLDMLENVLKFITRNAYIAIAIYGYSFCRSAKKSFTILVENVLTVGAINSAGDFALFMCKLIVVLLVGFIGFEMMKRKEAVISVWVPVLIACLFAYLIADCFLSIFEMVIDTLFICFAEDCERNDGVERPYFMSASLMELVENHRNKENKENKEEESEVS